MDQNLDDSLTLEGSMGVDFEHPEAVEVAQGDISLDVSGHEEGISMEFENIGEQPTLMDTGSEEIIGHDFMEDQFGLQEYSITDDQITAETTVQSDDVNLHGVMLQDDQHMFASSNALDLEYDLNQETVTIPSSGELQHTSEVLPKIVSLGQSTPQVRRITSKKDLIVLTQPPRQVAIAPKPPKLLPAKVGPANTFLGRKQYQIAPKPVTLVSKTPVSFVNKISMPAVNTKPNPLLAQIRKQIVMVPGRTQKYKLVSAGSSVRLVAASEGNMQSTPQLIPTTVTKNMKPVKVILQGQGTGEAGQQKILTKFLHTSAGFQPTRYVTMQQKTVPITDKNIIMASPTKDGIKYVPKKQQIIAIKSPTTIAPAGSAQGTTTKKVVISANPSQNIVLKTSMPSKTEQITSVTAGQKSQLHQINVPGKGIQYIRLLTNPTTSQAAAAAAPVKVSKPITVSSTTKTFILSKDDIIEMTEKSKPLVVSSSALKEVTSKPQPKLVRIAPVPKPQATMPQARSGQSLLAPISPAPSQKITLEDVQNLLEAKAEMNEDSTHDRTPIEHEVPREEEMDSKTALRALIADAVGEDMINDESTEIIGYDISQKNISDEMDDSEHPLIVIPSYNKNDSGYSHQQQDGRQMMSRMVNIEVDPMNMFNSPSSPREMLDGDIASADLGMRPRKACNCTKSQCLKLYCDCFANGEFCNRCNCNNCNNNLENEELRQKAIRGCLDRNPNAFRPKIGKSKTGGPEIIRRHNKGCNCKRSGCLKNYCECYEAKIACSAICKCVGCRNVEEGEPPAHPPARPAHPLRGLGNKQPCTFMTTEVISAVCQCLFAAAVEGAEPARCVIEEFARCLHDIISAAQHAQVQA